MDVQKKFTNVNPVRDVLINRNAVPKHVKTELSE